MKQILLFGAGKSATVLIGYLLEHASSLGWHLIIVDSNAELAEEKLKGSAHGSAMSFDITDSAPRDEMIRRASIVISMLPPALHRLVAESCLTHERHLLTASYVDDLMKSMAPRIAEKGLLFLCEMGLDPGVDHMSAMKLFHEIQTRGGRIRSFYSHCGGLIAPESDDNPWHYKISWNPRNIIMAGSSGAVYKKDARVISLPYADLFSGDQLVSVPGLSPFAWYANRDSLSYIPLYGLHEAGTVVRTTLRHPDFIRAWRYIVLAGLTSELTSLPHDNINSYRQWLDQAISRTTEWKNFGEFLQHQVAESDRALVAELFEWSGLLSDSDLPASVNCNADVLQSLFESRLSLQPGDRDMIVMLHEIEYELDGQTYKISSSLVVKGTDQIHTAMAKTVGLPLAIATRLILTGVLKLTGLQIPILPEIYNPVLEELARFGVDFKEELSRP